VIDPRRKMMNTRTLTTLIALGISVSACGGTGSRGLESVHQPVVARADYSFDVTTASAGLAAGDAARLAGWFDALQLGYGDKVSVDLGGNYNDSEARGAIASIAARYGLLLEDIPPSLSGDVAPGGARVIVSRLKATVPSCPTWKGSGEPNFGNKTSSNYGCATNSNLAAMIANPEDLVRGAAGSGTTDAASAAKGVNLYRSRKPSGDGELKTESTGGSK
jgi:pilus assembly protein CpaD